jgi:hypothetical protein
MIGKPDEVATRDVAERTQVPDLIDDGAVVVSTEGHASLEEDVRSRLAS